MSNRIRKVSKRVFAAAVGASAPLLLSCSAQPVSSGRNMSEPVAAISENAGQWLQESGELPEPPPCVDESVEPGCADAGFPDMPALAEAAPELDSGVPSPFEIPAAEEREVVALNVSDDELAEMRGRFVSAEGLAYFGIEMVTQWQTASGELLTAGLSLNANLSPVLPNGANVQIRPTVSIVRTADQPRMSSGGAKGGDTSSATVAGNGLGNAGGVVQGIQVAGDTNRIVNDVRMNISVRSGEGSSGEGQNAGLGDALLNAAGTRTVSSASGAFASASVSGNSLDVAVGVPDQGEVLQRIRGGGADRSGVVFQHARIFGDTNRIHNVINIDAEMIPINSVNSVNVDAAVNSVRGLQQ